jgi:hypothetical protein
VSNNKDHKRFCENDGWELFKSTDHDHYRKTLSSGEIIYTRISRGSKQYSPSLFAEILKRQLRVTKEEFNSKI